jgi:hypothetical protein
MQIIGCVELQLYTGRSGSTLLKRNYVWGYQKIRVECYCLQAIDMSEVAIMSPTPSPLTIPSILIFHVFCNIQLRTFRGKILPSPACLRLKRYYDEHNRIVKNVVFWAVTPCDSCKNRRLGRFILRSVLQLLVTAKVPSSPIRSLLMIEAILPSETSVLTRATRCYIQKDGLP